MNHDAGKMYLEYYAKVLLESLYPEIYTDIRNDESPDLRMGSDYGIEVTWAMFENQGQANGVLNRIRGKEINQIDQRYVKTMDRIQTEIITNSKGNVCGYMPKDAKNKVSYTEMLLAYRKKKALQYETIKTDLFIYPPLAQLDGWIGREQIGEFFEIIRDDSANPFGHLIVFEEPTLYLYDFLQKTMLLRRGTKEQITSCKLAADSYSGWSKRYS